MNWKRYLTFTLIGIAALSLIYGAGRLYYRVTGGFLESNIVYDRPADPRWKIAALNEEETKDLNTVLSQEFLYLGKGCQSYVFRSRDDKYVIKFFKYQRFRPQAWLDYFAFIPPVDKYRIHKIQKKARKLENVYSSWKVAYEELKPETGVIYVHLDKEPISKEELVIFDKLGLQHNLKLANLEFMVQKKAKMLCPAILELKKQNDLKGSQELIDKLFAMILFEYERGYADNDHALMQNTGVFEGQPIHIDVGQFIKNPIVKEKKVQDQELFSKTWKFRIWLRKNYPELADYTEARLRGIIGESFDTLKPELNKASMGRIPNQG